MSSLARVPNSGSLFQSNVCNLFLTGIYLLSVLSGVAGCPQGELTVLGMIQKAPNLNKPLSTNTSSVRLQHPHSTFQLAQSLHQEKKLS